MADAKGSVRMNISVPAELKRDMDKADDSVNWSGVAAQAFREKLAELQSTKEATTMDDVIARMKAAAELENNKAHKFGLEAGKKWAKSTAKPRELRRLERTVYGNIPYATWDDPSGFIGSSSGTDDPAARMVCATIFDNDATYDDADEFFTATIGDYSESVMADTEDGLWCLQGFVEGTLEVWDAVKAKL